MCKQTYSFIYLYLTNKFVCVVDLLANTIYMHYNARHSHWKMTLVCVYNYTTTVCCVARWCIDTALYVAYIYTLCRSTEPDGINVLNNVNYFFIFILNTYKSNLPSFTGTVCIAYLVSISRNVEAELMGVHRFSHGPPATCADIYPSRLIS